MPRRSRCTRTSSGPRPAAVSAVVSSSSTQPAWPAPSSKIAAAASGAALPDEFRRLYGIWLALGMPAFLAMLAILWLMLTRPVLW